MKGLSSFDLKILKASHYVTKITEKHISFTNQFKLLMLETCVEGMTRTEAFNRTLGVTCFDKKYVDSRLGAWRRKIRSTGDLSLEKRGRKKDLESMTFEEMKAEIAYQKEVIAHLKKLRGLADDEL